MNTVVVDTNVVLVANRQHQDVSDDCLIVCTQRLQNIMKTGRLAIDDQYNILIEYQNKTKPKTSNRPGDAFVKWVLQNNANPERVVQVALKNHKDRGFESFPDNVALTNFDPPDRKFIAVSLAHPNRPPILQATDSKWLEWVKPLKQHGVTIDFLCPNDIQQFQKNKSKK